MDGFVDDDYDENFQFFDAPEEIMQEFTRECGKVCEYEYHVWVRSLSSVDERRRDFIGLMELDTLELGAKILDSRLSAKKVFDKVVEDVDDVVDVRTEDEYPCSSMSKSNMCPDNPILNRRVSFSELSTQCSTVESSSSSNKNKGSLRRIKTPRLSRLLSSSKLKDGSCVSPTSISVKKKLVINSNKLKEASCVSPRSVSMKKKLGEGDCDAPLKKSSTLVDRWLRRWNTMRCSMNRSTRPSSMVIDSLTQACAARVRRIKVKHCRRKLRELSALFTGQTIQAHDGSILAMKFSPDGRYLATAGDDRMLKIWKVVEEERLDSVDIPDADPSCVYFSVNHLAELEPLMVEKDKYNKPKELRKTADSACVIFPPNVFRILERPLHIFEGHTADILDLSWSKDNHLLSASADKTVRLWKVCIDECLEVFNHTDYVTCIQFNPVNDDHFISGSIDGKVRIWTISDCQVVQWAELREIITAVCYRPDGQGGIVGSITGDCRIFNLIDNIFVLDMDCLMSKKKSPCKRITGFEFFPQDPSKVLVTSADSHVRVLDGSNVIGKFKGFRNSGSYASATLTSDGKHIVSASDDSNVYIWNYNPDKDPAFTQTKAIKSFECFLTDTSVAIPWSGLRTGTLDSSYLNSLPFWSSTCFSLTHEDLVDTGSKGSATWPEEKLPPSSSPCTLTTQSPISKSHYKLFKTSYNCSLDTHAWGLVIVTASWDGQIKSFQNYGLPAPV